MGDKQNFKEEFAQRKQKFISSNKNMISRVHFELDLYIFSFTTKQYLFCVACTTGNKEDVAIKLCNFCVRPDLDKTPCSTDALAHTPAHLHQPFRYSFPKSCHCFCWAISFWLDCLLFVVSYSASPTNTITVNAHSLVIHEIAKEFSLGWLTPPHSWIFNLNPRFV